MKRYGEGLGLEIVKGVNSGQIAEPITYEKVKRFCEEKELYPTENQIRTTLSHAAENEQFSTHTKYFERTARGRYIVRNEYRSSVEYYWLNIDPNESSFSSMGIGEGQTWTNLNKEGGRRRKESSFRAINIGDMVLIFETGSTRAITTVCKVTDKDEEAGVISIQFSKQRHFTRFLTINRMKEMEVLASSPIAASQRGTLLSINQRDYRAVVKELEKLNSLKNYFEKLEKEVGLARRDSHAERRKRLENRKQVEPEKSERMITLFHRNPDVIAEVLERANGICENCGRPAPFNKESDGTPYLEIHHHFRLADGGEDTVENAIAVCPNCHRELHYG